MFDDAVATFPRMLQQAGYHTAFMGKWHMSLQEGPRPGFNRWIGLIGQGDYYNPTFYFDGEKRQVNGYVTDLLTSYAVDWLRQPRDDGPFCLYLAHKATHADFLPAVRHSKLFADMPMPKPQPDTLEGKPEWVKKLSREWGAEEDEFVRNYLRTLMAVDEGIGRVLAVLEETGRLDNTVIVFAGDNGFFLGEHGGLRDKRHMYEESIRIPLLVRYPRLVKPGLLEDRMVLNIDICPTFLDLAGVSAPGGVQGRSLVPLLKGRDSGWREDFLYVYEFEPQYKKRPGTRGVRTERWKYIEYPDIDDKAELYDLKNDPKELDNLIDDPRHAVVVADMRARFDRLVRETGYAALTK
jgi:arylsulfatase A-like enzyme